MGHHSSDAHSSRSSKHQGSSKGSHSGKHPDRHSNKKESSNPSRSEQGENDTPFTFLFVVNQIELNPNAPPTVDFWGTAIPPDNPSHYAGEYPGTVFRYTNGWVQQAHGYEWVRDGGIDPATNLRPAGRIVWNHENGAQYPMDEYSTFTVFNCWRPLPVVYVETDPMSTPIGAFGAGLRWNLMSFDSPDHTGITRIAAAGGSQIISGRSPSWAPSLVPDMFRNPFGNLPRSAGLAGALPVIIGQMALTHPPGQTDVPFINQVWQHRRWEAPQTFQAAVRYPNDLRGVLVHVALDHYENPVGSTEDGLRNFEMADVIVRE
ncbi:hypothetical protein HD806DRAFT_551252 [Xylariaceae sp. AK1471]|nr:hypothetical protein HD806DRAFT_551252 [Xylariaceae sp. AK1471]